MSRKGRRLMAAAVAIPAVACATALATTPGTNGRIAFRRYFDADQSRAAVFTMRPDGTDVRRITHAPKGTHDDQPDWSPDGTRIAFTRFPDDGPAYVEVVGADGTGLTRVTPRCGRSAPNRVPRGCEDAANVSFTQDGQHVTYSRATGRVRQFPKYEYEQIEHSAIAIVGVDGSGEREILRLPRYAGDLEFPQVSPDGRMVLFERRNSPLRRPRLARAIFVMDVDGTDVHRVTPWKLAGGDNPDWAPDSSRILFRSMDEVDDERSQYYTVRPDGTGLTKLTSFPFTHRRLFSASFSPDGRQIVFAQASDAKGHRTMWTMDADGTNPRVLLDAGRFDSADDWGTAP